MLCCMHNYVIKSLNTGKFSCCPHTGAKDFFFKFSPCQSISKSLPNQLGIHNFLVKQEKMASNNLASQLGIFSNLAYFLPQRVNMPSCHRDLLVRICSARSQKLLVGLFFFGFGKLKIANSWTWALFLLGILFCELAKHLICEVKDSKLLKML